MEIAVMTKLMELADEIRALSKQTCESVIAIGNKLIEAKKIVGHGNFLPWIKTEFGWSEDTAQRFMRLADDKNRNLRNLDVPLSALYLLTAPNTPDEAIDAVSERVESGEKLSLEDVKEEIAAAKPKRGGGGVKPRDNQVEAIAREHKAKTGEWPTSAQLAKKAEVNPRSADNALRAAKAFEAGQTQGAYTEKMVSIHVLIEKLSPLFERVLAQSKAHRAALSHTELAMIAGEGRRLLDSWASDDPTVRRVRGHVVPPKPPAPKGRKEDPKCPDLSLN